jgi:hypothetical protein
MRRGRTVGLVVASMLLSSLTGCAAPDGSAPPDSGTDSVAPSASAAPSPVTPARRARSVPQPQAPSRAVLPSGRTVAVRTVGTTAAGVLDVPDDIEVAGWWQGGARLGDPFGSILVAAHVDSTTQGLGPFAELLTVAPGARVRLTSPGLAQTYEVRSRRLLPQGTLDRGSGLFDASGAPRLTLVTCAPPYDASRGGYQNLAVVTAVPVSSVERR